MTTATQRDPVLIFKSTVKQHIRVNPKTGAQETVHEYQDKRQKQAQPMAGQTGPKAPAGGAGASRSMPGHDSQRIPTRLMGDAAAKKIGADPTSHEHTIGMKEMKANPKLWEHNVGLLRHYPGTPDDMKDAPSDQLAEHTVNRWKENLLWLHDKVPEETRQRSKLWYDGARKITDKWAGEYGLHPASIAGAIAALSPQKDWYMNVSSAKRVIETLQTKQDHTWDDAMTKKVSEIPSMSKYPDVVAAVTGKKLGELTDAHDKAFWIRAYDETHNDRSYPILSPEGDELAPAQNKPDKAGNKANSKMGWGSLVEIKKALSCIEANGDLSKISPLMGEEHKVRNFYNNIVAPNSDNGEITSDTHAVAAAELRPMAGSDEPVLHNFGSGMPKDKQEKFAAKEGRPYVNAKSDASGVSGTYGLVADAYRRAAKERGILPREMQSITWEAGRGLFKDTQKTDANRSKTDAIWKDASSGKISTDEARNKIHDVFGGIEPPTWHPDHPDNAGKDGNAGGRDAGVDAGSGGGSDDRGVRGSELGRGEDAGGSDGGSGAGQPDSGEPAGEGRGGERGADGAGYTGPSEVAPEAPKDPKIVLEHGKEYEFQHHHPESGVAVRAKGKVTSWGRDGATMVSQDGQTHKVPWSSLSPKEKAEQQASGGAKPRARVKAGSSVKKAQTVPDTGDVLKADFVRVDPRTNKMEQVHDKRTRKPAAEHPEEKKQHFILQVQGKGGVWHTVRTAAFPSLGAAESYGKQHHAGHVFRAVPAGQDAVKKSNDYTSSGDDFFGVPIMVFAGQAAQAADLDAAAATANANPAPVSDPGPAQAVKEEEPPAAEPAHADPRASYTQRAVNALRNFWKLS